MTGSAQPTAAQPVPSIANAARLRHIEALARRAQQHKGLARRLMEARLQQLRDALAAEGPHGPNSAPREHQTLALLLAHINNATASTAGAAPQLAPGAEPGRPTGAAPPTRQPSNPANHRAAAHGTTPPAAAPELKAISQYRSTWSRLSAEQRLHQALAQVPSNTGPLNTQRLLHQALAAMRDASPHYLHRFMVQVETLLWLEQLNTVAAPAAASKAPGRKTRP